MTIPTYEQLAAQLKQLHDRAAKQEPPPWVKNIQSALDQYKSAVTEHARLDLARKLGMNVELPDPETAAWALFAAVEELPELQQKSNGTANETAVEMAPEASMEVDPVDDAVPDIPAPKKLSRALQSGYLVLYGGTPEPKRVQDLKQLLKTENVTWHETKKSRAVDEPPANAAAVIAFFGCLAYESSKSLLAWSRRTKVPFTQVKRPGKGAIQKALQDLESRIK